MNSSIIRYILGSVLKLEGALMALPCLVSVIYKEKEGLSYLAVALGCLAFGFLLTFKKPKDTVFYLKEGCVSTALSWIMLSIFGCIPFVLTKEIPSFTNALFETISGFTTTGATILDDVESLSHTSMFWRSFTHWIGGMGVLVFLLAVVPLSGGSTPTPANPGHTASRTASPPSALMPSMTAICWNPLSSPIPSPRFPNAHFMAVRRLPPYLCPIR